MFEEGGALRIIQYVEQKNWKAIEALINQSESVKVFGFQVSLNDDLRPRCEVSEIKPHHLGGVGQGYINGAIVSAMFDLIMGLTALPYVSQGYFATSSLNIRFLKPIKSAQFYADAELVEKIDKSLFSAATLYNGDGEPCARASGEVRIGIL